MPLVIPAIDRSRLEFLHTPDGGPPPPGYRAPTLTYRNADVGPADYPKQVAAVHSLAAFADYVWPVLHPDRPFRRGPHVDVICFALEQLVYGNVEGNELVISIPPRMLKSVLVNVFLTPWVWLHSPRVIATGISASENVAFRDNQLTREIVLSARYKALQLVAQEVLAETGVAPQPWELKKGQNQKQRFENTARGKRFALAAGADIIGEGMDLQLIDDPIDAKEVLEGSQEQVLDRMAQVITKYNGIWATRMQDPGRSPRVVIMQRLHQMDLAGYLLDRGCPSVVLPMEYEPDHPDLSVFDWRITPGETLLPDHYPLSHLAKLKNPDTGMGPFVYASQFQQRPTPGKGGRFDTELWGTYTQSPSALVHEISTLSDNPGMLITSWDCASKTGSGNAATVGLLLGWWRNDLYVLDMIRERVELPELDALFQGWLSKYPMVYRHLIEDASNGIPLLQLHRTNRKLVGIKTQGQGDKETRAGYTERLQKRGKILLPHGRPWANIIKKEHAFFPRGSTKDTVDALSQACSWLEQQNTRSSEQDMRQRFAWLTSILGRDEMDF